MMAQGEQKIVTSNVTQEEIKLSSYKVDKVDLTSYLEYYYEIVGGIVAEMWKHDPQGEIKDRHEAHGVGGLYELAKDFTDEFNAMHKNTVWGQDKMFLDEVDKFLRSKIFAEKDAEILTSEFLVSQLIRVSKKLGVALQRERTED
jgi:hypothetical protein